MSSLIFQEIHLENLPSKPFPASQKRNGPISILRHRYGKQLMTRFFLFFVTKTGSHCELVINGTRSVDDAGLLRDGQI